MKKILKIFGIGALGVVVLIVGIGIFAFSVGVDVEDSFPPYIEEAIPKLVTWDLEQYERLMSKEGLSAATPKQWQLYLDKIKKLGQLKTVGKAQFQGFRTSTAKDTTYASYLVPVTFTTGEAHIQLALQHSNGKTEINSVRFLSDLLLE